MLDIKRCNDPNRSTYLFPTMTSPTDMVGRSLSRITSESRQLARMRKIDQRIEVDRSNEAKRAATNSLRMAVSDQMCLGTDNRLLTASCYPACFLRISF